MYIVQIEADPEVGDTFHYACEIDGIEGVESATVTALTLEGYEAVKEIHAELGRWLAEHRLETPGKTYDHDPRPDDDAEPGHRCRTCGEDITWVGPDLYNDWMHVDDKENR